MNPTQANSYVCHIRRAVPTQKKAQERIIVYYELFQTKPTLQGPLSLLYVSIRKQGNHLVKMYIIKPSTFILS